MYDQGTRQKEIAKEIGFSPSTISRKLKRYGSTRNYYASTDQKVANFCKASANQLRRKKYNPILIRYILYSLKKKCSPEQIAGRLKFLYPNDPDKNISHETIYSFFEEKKLNFTPFLRMKIKTN